MLSQVVGVPAAIVAVAPPLPTETETETRQLLSFIVFDEQGLFVSSVHNDFMALKLVIHPSATGTALEHAGARGVIQCNGEKFCCVCVNLYDRQQYGFGGIIVTVITSH